jgi:hypothetical protein
MPVKGIIIESRVIAPHIITILMNLSIAAKSMVVT